MPPQLPKNTNRKIQFIQKQKGRIIMRVKMLFDLNKEEDATAYKLTNKAPSMYDVLWEYSQWLRNNLKHGNFEGEALEAMEQAQTQFYLLLEEADVSLDIV